MRDQLALYLVADPESASGDLLRIVSEALEGGVSAVQLRAQRLTDIAIWTLAKTLRSATLSHGALFFVNDRVDIAMAVGADGVHLGVGDLPVPDVSRIAPHLIVGFSPETDEQLVEAANHGAHYFGVGPVFATSSKSDAGPPIGLETLRRRVSLTRQPVIGIGGISEWNAVQVMETGAAGVAVVGAIMSSFDPAQSARTLRRMVNESARTAAR